MSDLQKVILDHLSKNQRFQTAEIVAKTGFSRATVHIELKKLVESGKIVLVGKANKAHYVSPSVLENSQEISENTSFLRTFTNNGLEEDVVFKTIDRETSILRDLPKNVRDILYYAFTEMMNNAIEHSQSAHIIVMMQRLPTSIKFEIADRGIGIFNNIRTKKNLGDTSEAIETLLKGRQTTDPTRHSGEGIFFTSRVADLFQIKSSAKQLTFDNAIPDVFLGKSRVVAGTKVVFQISRNSTRTTSEIFSQFTDDSYAFTKTQVHIDLHKGGNGCISRSQARRVVNSLDPFHEVILDFGGVDSIGQGFADEVFRVWQNAHPDIRIRVENANEDVLFMINRAKSTAFR